MINNDLIFNLDKIHTTELGIERIKNNLDLDITDIVKWCKNKIKDPNCHISRKGKNWYVNVDNCMMTINSYSYTIITSHKLNEYDRAEFDE
ncbi:hypothetical protein AGMMS4952_27370 [Spirochaetia bacterium]|nr:hypothetical protein AGMMS4952_27370 [Spirochaetia bacterium]